ncbi:MAG TPA: IS66 family transposase [Terriglobales bacterium]|nr:IS66 family transposase [Terriglobales bacterium]
MSEISNSPAAFADPSDPILIEQLKQQLARQEQQLAKTEQQLQYAELKIQQLEERLRQQRIAKYGAGSEKLSNLQLHMLEQEPGVSQAEVQAEGERPVIEGDVIEVAGYQRKPRRCHPGRQSLPADLPRVEKIIACPTEQCRCGQCGQPTTVIGYEESEQLEVEPAKYFVLVVKREKRACTSCKGAKIVAAPLPVRIIEKGLVSDQVVIDTVIRKYCDHLPLYRQSVILDREWGVDISRATLDGWVMQVGEMLRPLVGVIGRELVQGSYLQADETPIEVQMHDRRGKNHQAYLWQYGRPGGATVFDFRLGRDRAGPKYFLQDFHGLLQTDGYAAYDKVGGAGMVHAACWAHCRRGFANVVKLNPGDPVASPIVAAINELFAVDAEAREQNLSVEARHHVRQQRAPVLLEKIKAAIVAAKPGALPGGALENACQYALGLWPRLTRFLEYPELELSNNWIENSMRPIALGRKNWIHIGSPEAGPKVAAILSVIETCRRLKISVRDYLSAILPGLANVRVQRLAALTPNAWAAQHK